MVKFLLELIYYGNIGYRLILSDELLYWNGFYEMDA